jgi:WD40 repeat protein
MALSPTDPIQSPEQSLYFACWLPAADRLRRFCVSAPERHDFFMAYTFQDVGMVRAIDAAIRVEGFKSWIGDLEALVSQGYKGNVDQGIRESDGFVLLVPDQGLPDDLLDELKQALDLNKLVILLARRPLSPKELPFSPLQNVTWTSLTHVGSSYGFKEIAILLTHSLTYVRLLARALEWQHQHYAQDRLLSLGDLQATQSRLAWIEGHLSKAFAIQPVQRQFIEASQQHIKTGKRTDYFQGKPADVFISYSSKDRDFVRELANFLTDHELGVWVDWENIPIATRWRDEVGEGIRAAHTFLFVISPHSVVSEHCHWELNQARQCGRRIIPLCCDRAYDPQRLETLQLSELSYVPFEELDFDLAAAKVVTAIRTDLQDVKTYNRLYTKAYEWHTHERSVSLLLERKEYQKVQSWLRTRRQSKSALNDGQHHIPLHPLQTTFLEASQVALRTERRQRMALAGFTLAGFAATLLVAAYARLGEVKAMVASLEEKVGLDGLITALHAGKRLRSNPYLRLIQPDLPLQTTMALHQETLTVRELNRLNGHQRGIFDVAFSPLGPNFTGQGGTPRRLYLVSGGEDKTVRVWSLAGPVVQPFQEHTDAVVSTAFSSDGDFFVTGSYDGSANLWSCSPRFIQQYGQGTRADGKPVIENFSVNPFAADVDPAAQPCQWIKTLPEPEPTRLFTVGVSPGSQYVAAAGRDGNIRLWQRAQAFEAAPRLLSHDSPVYSVDFNLHHRVMVAADRSGQVKIWNLETGTLVSALDVGQLVLDVRFSHDGNLIVLGGDNGLLQVWDWQGEEQRVLPLEGHDNLVTQVRFNPQHTSLASADVDGLVKIWDIGPILEGLGEEVPSLPDDYEPIILRGHIDGVNRIRFSPDGRFLATASLDDTIRLWMAADGALLDVIEGHQDEVTSIAFSPPIKRNYYDELEIGDYYLASSSRDGTIRLWKVNNDVRPLPHTNRVFDVAFSPDGKLLASSGRRNIRLWRLADNTMIAHIGHQQGDLYSVSYGHDNRIQLLAVGDSLGQISLWRPQVSTKDVYRQWPAHQSDDPQAADEGVYAVKFSPDAQCFTASGDFSRACLASGGADGRVKFWSTRGELLGSYNLTDGTITSLSFTRDGSHLAVSTRPPVDAAPQTSGQIYLLSLDNSSPGQLKITVDATTETAADNHRGGILTLAFHPHQENVLISGGEDGQLRRWTIQGDTIHSVGAVMDRHTDAVTRAVFNRQGTIYCLQQ